MNKRLVEFTTIEGEPMAVDPSEVRGVYLYREAWSGGEPGKTHPELIELKIKHGQWVVRGSYREVMDALTRADQSTDTEEEEQS